MAALMPAAWASILAAASGALRISSSTSWKSLEPFLTFFLLFAISERLLIDAPQVRVVDLVCLRDHLPVEALGLAGLVASDQQHCLPPRVEGEEDADRPGCSQLLHVGISRTLDRVDKGPSRDRPHPAQVFKRARDFLFLGFAQRLPPLFELVRPFRFPPHPSDIARKLYNVGVVTKSLLRRDS